MKHYAASLLVEKNKYTYSSLHRPDQIHNAQIGILQLKVEQIKLNISMLRSTVYIRLYLACDFISSNFIGKAR